jgi:hypothetical protein
MTTALTSPDRAPQRVRSLAPREHGAYGQLGVPLLVALLSEKPGPVSWLLAGAAVVAFLTHEPLQILLGRRGGKALREDGDRARRALGFRGVGALVLGGAGLALSSGEARWAALLPGALALGTLGLLWRGWERTVPGEIVAAAALAGAGVPVAVSGGAGVREALGVWGAWALGFGAVTFAVRAVVSRDRTWVRWLGPLGSAAVAAACWRGGWMTGEQALGALPLLTAAVGLTAAPPAPTRLKAVGWTLMAASVAAGALLLRG